MAFKDDISINTIIGKGSTISGNVKVNGFVRVDGDIDGDLETDGNILIGEDARIRGNVVANSVTVGGAIIGDIQALDGVRLLSTSLVRGDILSHKVQIEDSAFFHGHCISIKDNENYQQTAAEYLQEKAIKEKVI